MKRLTIYLIIILTAITLLLPAAALAQSPVECEFEYTIQQGDWLSKLSAKYLGDPLAYNQLVLMGNADPNDAYQNIDDPNLIEPGWTICIPKDNGVVFRGGTSRLSEAPIGNPGGALSSVSAQAQPGFQQFIFQFEGEGVPGFDMYYLNDANMDHNSGQEVPLQGDVKLRVAFEPGNLNGYSGDTRIAANGNPNVHEAVYVMQEDNAMVWAIGMDKMSGYLVSVLQNPSRIVLDIFDPVPGASDRPELLVGSQGDAIAELQQILADFGYLTQLPADPRYNEATRKAVVAYQQAEGLTQDGIVGAETWAHLLQDQTAQSAPPPPAPTPAAAPPTDGPARTHAGYLTHTPDGKPIVYMTFDDGPSTYTPQYLDLLAQYNAHATFFIIGQQAATYADTLRAEATAGHYLASHTWDHANLTQITREQFFEEIDSTHQAIIDAAGDLFTLDKTVAYLRPPYGAMDDTTRAEAAERGYTMVFWDIDTLDWKRPGVDVIVNYVLDEIYPGANVLMHDGGGNREQTIAALKQVLPALQEQGYAFYNVWEGAQ